MSGDGGGGDGRVGDGGLGGKGGVESEDCEKAAHRNSPLRVTFLEAAPDTMRGPMKAYVYVTLKKTVLDAQGKTVTQALRGMGHTAIADVRQGKYFELTLAEGTDLDKVRPEIEQIAAEVLANPVIEDYRIEFGS